MYCVPLSFFFFARVNGIQLGPATFWSIWVEASADAHVKYVNDTHKGRRRGCEGFPQSGMISDAGFVIRAEISQDLHHHH